MNEIHEKPVALVTGGNRGLGRETARQLAADHGYAVVLSARSQEKAKQAADELKAACGADAIIEPMKLDVTMPEDAVAMANFLGERFGRLDALVNNAGAILEQGWPSILETEPDAVRRTFENNTISALNVTQALVALLLQNGGGNIVMVSSIMGGLTEMGGNHFAYRVSKTGLNVLTRVLHAELAEKGVRVNSVCPGFVKTGLSAANVNADREVAEGAKGIVWAATLHKDGPSGGFFRDGQPVPW